MENKSFEDEISLKELIVTLIRGWKTVMICTIVIMVFALIYILGIAKPVYESSISGVINIPETAMSKYGTYTFPSSNKLDYLNVVKSYEVLSRTKKTLELKNSISSLREQIVIDTLPEQNTFTITVSSDSPENARELVVVLSAYLVDELSTQYKINAIDYFMRELSVEENRIKDDILKQEKILESQKMQLEKVEKVVTLKRLLVDDPILAASIANSKGIDLATLSDDVMYEEMLNPNFSDLEAANIELEKSIQNAKILIDEKKVYYQELVAESEALNQFYTSGVQNTINNDSLDIIRSRININKTASYNDSPVSPNKILILAISVVLGLMIGVFMTFFKHYWKEN